MKKKAKWPFIGLVLFLMYACSIQEARVEQVMWYRAPAPIWEATLPLGNGRIGIMPDGHLASETLVLNDITLWSGSIEDPNNPDALQYLPQIRQLLFEGKNDLAQELVYKTFVCQGAGSGRGRGNDVPYGSFEVLGNLRLNYVLPDTAGIMGYRRQLNLDNAIATTSFNIDDVGYSREYFTSFTDDVAVVRLKATKKGKISLQIGLDRPERIETFTENNLLLMDGQLNNGIDGKGMQFRAVVKAIHQGGTFTTNKKQLDIRDADEVTLFISMGTDFRDQNFRESVMEKAIRASSKPYSQLKNSHIAEYKRYFDRVGLDLGVNPEREKLPVDERLQAFANDPDDPGLVVLYFQFGRYLLISSAHAQVLPPNLQGLWAKTIHTPWNGDYHLNINVQMNHWPAEIASLPEMHRPLIELTKGLVAPGTETARVFYNARGWVAHMMTNVWGFTAPGEHPSWGATNTGGAWLCAHLWEHFDFGRDTAYLRDIYPVLKGASQFFLDMLVTDPNTGWLVTAPTTSPENAFYMPGTLKAVNICMGSTMDNQLIRELFRNTARATEVLGEDLLFSQLLSQTALRLPPNRVGSDGRLMEWLEEYEERDPQHRHVSHLYGLHPGMEITTSLTPELAKATRLSLERRGDGGTGWSRAWKINFWARLNDGNRAFTLLKNLLEPVYDTAFNYTNKGGTYPNLFCAHPPFQIDGNFGGTAGIAEMFLQSHAGFIEIIPALPNRFDKGSFYGLRVRGDASVAASWKDRQLTEASITANKGGVFKIKIPDGISGTRLTVNHKKRDYVVSDNYLTVVLEKGETALLKFSDKM